MADPSSNILLDIQVYISSNSKGDALLLIHCGYYAMQLLCNAMQTWYIYIYHSLKFRSALDKSCTTLRNTCDWWLSSGKCMCFNSSCRCLSRVPKLMSLEIHFICTVIHGWAHEMLKFVLWVWGLFTSSSTPWATTLKSEAWRHSCETKVN